VPTATAVLADCVAPPEEHDEALGRQPEERRRGAEATADKFDVVGADDREDLPRTLNRPERSSWGLSDPERPQGSCELVPGHA